MAYRKLHPYQAEKQRYRKLQSKYGLTKEMFETMLVRQNNCCVICKKSEPGGRGMWHVDHSHLTGKIRGLLCAKCNQGLGYFNDSKALLDAASAYLALSGSADSQK
jgi:hypothetical protein